MGPVFFIVAVFGYFCDDGTDPNANGCCRGGMLGLGKCPANCTEKIVERKKVGTICHCSECGNDATASAQILKNLQLKMLTRNFLPDITKRAILANLKI